MRRAYFVNNKYKIKYNVVLFSLAPDFSDTLYILQKKKKKCWNLQQDTDGYTKTQIEFWHTKKLSLLKHSNYRTIFFKQQRQESA